MAIYLLMLAEQAIAATCESTVKHHINTELHASALFPSDRNTFVVVLCKTGKAPIYDKFFAYIHDTAQHKYNAPTGGLARLEQVLDPNGKTRTTGVVVRSLNEPQEYTLKTRTRMASGEAIDIAKTFRLARKDFDLFVHSGVTVGIVRL